MSERHGGLTPERWAEIETAMTISEDFSDGAWHGYMFTEKGFDPDEVVAWNDSPIHQERIRKYTEDDDE